ncbi:MAG: phospholipid carrier-dependent glycosyltransferase, partial [Anaerolineae bacterium]|nr:phospholipid carrier-dependent glycosyltransferase [Anaerolineae bacterium]
MRSWATDALRGDRLAVLLVLAFAVVAGMYSVVTPVFEAPDEIQHFYYVKHLVETRRLPVQGPEGKDTWAQEGSQPPLYYILAAVLASPVDLSDTEEVVWLNPQANVGDPLWPANKNRIVHREDEEFPYQGTVLAVHLARLLSVVLGAGTVWFAYLLARELLPGRRYLPLAAAALVGFNPQFCFISGAVSNDSLITLLATVNLLCTVRYLLGRMGRRHVVLWGGLLGLAALTKVSGLLLLGLAAVAVLASAWHRRTFRQGLGDLGTLVALWLAVAGWWYARNWVLYGEP